MKWRGPLAGMAAVLVTAGAFFCGTGMVEGAWGSGKATREEVRAGMETLGRELRQKELSQSGRRHWNLGDVVERELDGKVYQFACIDQNYADRMENHGPYALFLCTSVIPADLGSEYRYEELEDGTYDYVFYPGEIVNFGDENDYKYSRVRRWLEQCESGVPEAADIYTGVDVAYEGRTEEGMYGQMDGVGLRGSYIGNQKLTEKLFCLSVDEAMEYREELWKFEGSRVENPESQYGPYSKGYWLRTPVGDGNGFKESGMVYVVDLVNGMIRPQTVKPVGGDGTGELDVTGTIGVRPAFAMLQGV